MNTLKVPLIPSDEVKAVMDKMRVQQGEAKLRALEQQRISEEDMRIFQEYQAKKAHQLLIEAEAQVRLEIENYDEACIQEIKNKIKQYPNMHNIELCDMFTGKIHPTSEILSKKKEIYDAFILKCRKEVEEEIASENEILRLEAQTKLHSDIAEANKALPLNKINGGEFEEDRLEIDYIIGLNNPIPSMADTRSSGLYFETRHLWESMNTQIQNRANPQLKEIPVSWNNDYKDNKIPFLPQCPVCARQNTILFKWGGGEYGSPRVYTKAIGTVQCFPHTSHYTWVSNYQ
jgi:hypothetical protein